MNLGLLEIKICPNRKEKGLFLLYYYNVRHLTLRNVTTRRILYCFTDSLIAVQFIFYVLVICTSYFTSEILEVRYLFQYMSVSYYFCPNWVAFIKGHWFGFLKWCFQTACVCRDDVRGVLIFEALLHLIIYHIKYTCFIVKEVYLKFALYFNCQFFIIAFICIYLSILCT